MVLRDTLVTDLDLYLNSSSFKDYCPNGLQIAGKVEINTLISGVTANQALIDAAIDSNADAVLVHHGFFFKGESEAIVGIKKNRIAALLKNDISLFAYHLPLDLHAELGNNVLFGHAMGWQDQEVFSMLGVDGLGRAATFATPISPGELGQQLAGVLQRDPQHLSTTKNSKITKVAWCTGAAQDGIVDAYMHGANAFISGEVSERTFAQAQELGVHYFVAGHHATETFGARALGEYCAAKYNLQHEFIDIVNPV